ncbi:MAG: hypothetical protein ACKVH8_25085 [Pirellulales bacterium]
MAEYADLRNKLKNFNYGEYLNGLDEKPTGMLKAHAHHILFKLGLGDKQKDLVVEGLEILIRHDIDPFFGKPNLVWAPNKAGQHTIDHLNEVMDALRAADNNGKGTRQAVLDALDFLGSQAAGL